MIPQLTWHSNQGKLFDPPDVEKRSAELGMRGSFFRQQWETSGPGQLFSICQSLRLDSPRPINIRLTVPGQIPTAATIDEQNCLCDAMLHDLDSRLSEMMRLTWVIAGCLVLQSRADTDEIDSDNNVSATARFSTGLHAASLTLKSGLDIGVLNGDSPSLIALANSLWGLQLDASGFEWLVESLQTSPA